MDARQFYKISSYTKRTQTEIILLSPPSWGTVLTNVEMEFEIKGIDDWKADCVVSELN